MRRCLPNAAQYQRLRTRRSLPHSAFPIILSRSARENCTQLEKRGCLIPQTYQAHRPENVIHASLERPGSSDWAALCSADGTVSSWSFLLALPFRLLWPPNRRNRRMQSHDRSGELGFTWGIDPASPKQIHEAQSHYGTPSARLDHDALADTFVEKPHHLSLLYAGHAWTVIDTSD